MRWLSKLMRKICLFCNEQTTRYRHMAHEDGYSGLAIADYFIKKCNEQEIPITNMAVLKMIYFAHGLAYPTLGRKLIKDPFYAWPWGPVEKNTYRQFNVYGGNPIQSISGITNRELLNIENDFALCSFLNKLIPLAKRDPFALSEKSHEPGAPWDVTTPYNEIDDKLVEVFYNARYGKQ